MADQSDVEQTLAAIVSGVLYPMGTGAASITGLACRVHRGWPAAATLDADLAAGRVTVTVSGDARGQRNTTRYPDEWRPTRLASPGLTVEVAGIAATFSGIAAVGQLAGILADDVAAVHRTVPSDTPSTVAAALASALSGVAGPLSQNDLARCRRHGRGGFGDRGASLRRSAEHSRDSAAVAGVPSDLLVPRSGHS